ncbi:hypothetical protein BJ322DRAFT_1024714 [Thelephora terrestris]|uniref:Uncharacterized protein n=1 Tax=Thelephora terrestris TaxID=56493 RepID=A0A9P6L180_9AGAM|nr:hypothetical protein BJ322DRAFT_1024714 [Thelephora terrestris]
MAHGQMLLPSPSLSLLVVVAVGVPTSDNIQVMDHRGVATPVSVQTGDEDWWGDEPRRRGEHGGRMGHGGIRTWQERPERDGVCRDDGGLGSATGLVERVPLEPEINNHPTVGDGESPQWRLMPVANAQMLGSRSSTPHPERAQSIIDIDEDSPLTNSSMEVEIVAGEPSPTKGSRLPQIPTKRSETSPVSSSSSTAASTSEARAVGEAFPDGTHETASESIPPNPHSDQHMTTPVRENAYLAVWDTSSPTPHSQPFEASDSDVDASDLPVLAYDLDNDPTAETYEIPAYPNYPNDEISEHLSARFVTGHIIGRICKVESDEEPGDAVLNEFFESSAIASEGPGDEVTPSDAFRSAEAPWDWLSAPNYGDLSLEDTVNWENT